jgi:glyoxylase I family protein
VSREICRIAALKKAGLNFRNEMEAGPGGKQIQLEDPDGNPLELFEPGWRDAKCGPDPVVWK